MSDTTLGLIVMAVALPVGIWLAYRLARAARKAAVLTFFAVLCIVSPTARNAFITSYLEKS